MLCNACVCNGKADPVLCSMQTMEALCTADDDKLRQSTHETCPVLCNACIFTTITTTTVTTTTTITTTTTPTITTPTTHINSTFLNVNDECDPNNDNCNPDGLLCERESYKCKHASDIMTSKMSASSSSSGKSTMVVGIGVAFVVLAVLIGIFVKTRRLQNDLLAKSGLEVHNPMFTGAELYEETGGSNGRHPGAPNNANAFDNHFYDAGHRDATGEDTNEDVGNDSNAVSTSAGNPAMYLDVQGRTAIRNDVYDAVQGGSSTFETDEEDLDI